MTTLKLFDSSSLKTDVLPRLGYGLFWLVLFVASLGAGQSAYAQAACDKTITANVVVLDNPTTFNRLGAQNPNWITYALERDVVYVDWNNPRRANPLCATPPEYGDLTCLDADGFEIDAFIGDSDHLKPITKVEMDDPDTPDKEGKTVDELLGKVELRPDKRPRPLVVRSVEGACLTVNFTNLLATVANPNNARQDQLINNDQVAGRCAGFHATGTEVREAGDDYMANDGSMVGANPGANIGDTNAGQQNCGLGLAAPGESRTYYLRTPHEGAFIINSYGATLGSEANSGNLAVGMFGALNVQPKGARIYRSQVTEEEMRLATIGRTPLDQPIIDYEVLYPTNAPWSEEGKAGLPIINMLAGDGCDGPNWTYCELVHSDINAIIAGPDPDGTWYTKCPNDDNPETPDECPYPLESVGKKNPQLPQRLEAFREFTSQFHDEQTNSQVFPKWYNDPVMSHVTHGVKDQFMINYGSGGIGSEIISNRLRTGPMHDCTDCAYEEFFLASQTVGDPAMLVNNPANSLIEQCDPAVIAGTAGNQAQETQCWRDKVNLANGPIEGNYALYQEDPANVHHAYTGDFVKYRNTHAGSFEQHIFHFHNHQWLFNPNDDNANYLDAQEIMPGSGHTYELVNGGAGNRNHTVGDAIFHCHFYPHFAQGMWYHQRNHDVFETGTVLAVSEADDAQKPAGYNSTYPQLNFHAKRWDLRSGKPAKGARALPDGELADGSPIPAVIPLPGKPMPYMPAHVEVRPVDRGAYSVLGGRLPPDGKPDSSQAIVDRDSVKGLDGIVGTKDDISPGYPFWLAGNECGPTVGKDAPDTLVGDACPQGVVGQRMATPPLDMLTAYGAGAIDAANGPDGIPGTPDDYPDATDWTNLGGGWDGGLPRHALLGYVSTGLSKDTNSRLDFRKIIEMSKPVYFPETGTDLEKTSMAYQAVRHRDSFANTFDGLKPTPVIFNADGIGQGGWVLNGAPPVPGGPYNDPCVDDNGMSLKGGHIGKWYSGDDLTRWTTMNVEGMSPFDAEHPRAYKIANLQIDAVFNKVGHHYSQERIIILWEDVAPTIYKERPPEPLVMRFNTFDCGKLLHANLVPHEFELDDFQVRTPTDIIGQHIHLPKWDLTTNDGAANGWNYEDGALAPGIVVERVHAINRFNGLVRVGAACALDANSGETFVDFDGTVFGCAAFDPAGLAGGKAILVTGSLPGQLSPIDLSDQVPAPTIDTGDPGAGDPQLVGNFCQDADGKPVSCAYDYAKGLVKLEALPHPFFGDGGDAFGGQHYTGARTVIQRILVDPVVNVQGVDRGLGLTFSHDHYGPSTFQQIGLYSTILAEPAGSKWVHNESGDVIGAETPTGPGTIYGPRGDGGPTTWQAAILTGGWGVPGYSENVKAAEVPHHREFYFEMSDFQHAYEKDFYVGADKFGVPMLTKISQPDPFNATQATAIGIQEAWEKAVNPTLKLTAGGGIAAQAFPDTVNAHPGCPGPLGQNDPSIPRPCAEAINIGHSSMWVTNYRNEPVGLRVFDPNRIGPDGKKGTQAEGKAGDLAFALMSRLDGGLTKRAIPQLSTQFGDMPYPVFEDFNNGTLDPLTLDPNKAYCDGINCDRRPGDPITPIMRAYERDHVKVKIQVGATEEQHQTTIHGMKWLSNGSGFGRSPNSGWRNFQSHGISEQFSLQVPITTAPQQPGDVHEYLYATDATRDGMWSGTWGILRAYRDSTANLFPLPDNPLGQTRFANDNPESGLPAFNGVCPADPLVAPPRHYDVSAVLANDVLPNKLNVFIPDNLPNNLGQNDNEGGPLVTAEGPDGILLDNPDTAVDESADNGGTLVYNRRQTFIEDVFLTEGGETVRFAGGTGPLNDPTAMMYVLTEDLVVNEAAREAIILAGNPDPCVGTDPLTGNAVPSDEQPNLTVLATCPVKLKDTAPVEPLVLRANAGDCITVDLRNRLPEKAPDLAGWQDTFWVVTRNVQVNPDTGEKEMSFFGNNLIRPSSYVGLHPQLVAYDINQHDGLMVGDVDDTREEMQLAPPGGAKSYRWYAGDIRFEDSTQCADEKGRPGRDRGAGKCVEIIATPVEFGGVNLLSADRIKQPQKGLFGALVIEPQGATWAEDTLVADGQGTGTATRRTRAQINVNADPGEAGSGGTYRETVAIAHKTGNLRWKDGTAVKNVGQPEFGVEGAEDSGHAGFNYGTEPSWFRFRLPPNVPSGGAKKENDANGNPVPVNDRTFGTIPNPQAFYANALVTDGNHPNYIPDITVDGRVVAKAGDPQTPVFRTLANRTTEAAFDTRMHVLNGASADRDSTYILHGHLWQRDPFVCPGESDLGLAGKCALDGPGLPATVDSTALGLNPIGKWMGGEEGMGHVYGHWPILFNAGGTDAVNGDFLYRDYAPNGNRNGMFGILRVTNVDQVPLPPDDPQDPDPPPPPPPPPPEVDPCKWNPDIPETDPECKKPKRR